MTAFDFVVVGSGPSGAMAAKTLLDDGAKVLMLDGGRRDERYAASIPHKNFVELRRGDAAQYRYFLGEDFASAAADRIGAGAQLTPPRRFLVDAVDRYLPLRSESFAAIESLARGGLGGGWGLNCAVFSDAELQRASLPLAPMHDAYQSVADRIGLCGAADDAQPYTLAYVSGAQPPLPLDPTAAVLARRYERERSAMRARGFALGRPALALLTQDRGSRKATALDDMDFYADAGGSGWRPALLLDELLAHPRFAYESGAFVTRFEEGDDGVSIAALAMDSDEMRTYAARTLVLACGALGSARLVLRSLGAAGTRLPLLCNDYTYVPCLVPGRVGSEMPQRNTGLVQLTFFHDPAGTHDDVAVGTIFSYRSLLLFRLLREMPLPVRDARAVMQYLLSGFLIVGIDHPDDYADGNALWLEPDGASPTGDALRVRFDLEPQRNRSHHDRERTIMGVLRRLGAWPLRRVRPPNGSSIHYAGTLPFGHGGRPFTLEPSGRLNGTRAVYVADASGFTFLPAKGVTLSLMANAHRVARGLCERS